MFRGQFSHTVDPKGRLSIPADFREALADGFGDKLMLAPNGNALDVYPERTWKALEDKVGQLFPEIGRDADTSLRVDRVTELSPEHRLPSSWGKHLPGPSLRPILLVNHFMGFHPT